MNKVESDLYKIGLVFGGFGVLLLLFLWITGIDLTRLGAPCIFHRVTGYYCPGCGGTRAVMAFVRGRWFTSFLYHPLVLYLAILFMFFMATNTIQIIGHGKCNIGMKYHDIYVYAMVGIIVVNWIVKNVQVWMQIQIPPFA